MFQRSPLHLIELAALRREIIRILVIGPAYGVERIVHELFRLGFAEVREWSKPQPTGRIHEVMRVLTRYVLAPTVTNHR